MTLVGIIDFLYCSEVASSINYSNFFRVFLVLLTYSIRMSSPVITTFFFFSASVLVYSVLLLTSVFLTSLDDLEEASVESLA